MSLRIKDAPLLNYTLITDRTSLPTGGNGDYSISMLSIRDWLVNYKMISTRKYVDDKLYELEKNIDLKINDSSMASFKYTDDKFNESKNYTDLKSEDVLNESKNYTDLSLSQVTTTKNKSYKTLALAQQAVTNGDVESDTLVFITDDGQNTGLWLYDGVELTKSNYDPVTVANAYTDLKTSTTLQESKDFTTTNAMTNKGTIANVSVMSYNTIGMWYVNGALDLPEDFGNSTPAVLLKNEKFGAHTIKTIYDRYNPSRFWYKLNVDATWIKGDNFPTVKGEVYSFRNKKDVYQEKGLSKVVRQFDSDIDYIMRNTPPNIYSHFGKANPLEFIYWWYDELLSKYPEVVSKAGLGLDGQGNPIYEYTFSPQMVRNSNTSRNMMVATPTISFVGCIHGHEVTSAIAMICYLTQYCKDSSAGEGTARAKTLAKLKVIPTINPSGTKASTRRNWNGVDLNRNFPKNWDEATGGKGTAPLSELESQILNKWTQEQTDSDMIISLHDHGDQAIAWGVAVSQKSQDILTNSFNQLSEWYNCNFIKPEDKVDQVLSFIGNSVAGGYDRYAAETLNIDTILIECPPYNHPLLGGGAIGSRFSAEKSIELLINNTINNAYRYHDYSSKYFDILPEREGVIAVYNQRNPLIDRLIVDVKVKNATPERLYRIGYIEVKATSVDNEFELALQFDSLLNNKPEYNNRVFLGTTTKTITNNTGVVDVEFNTYYNDNANVTYVLKIDTSYLYKLSGFTLAMWNSGHSYYNYVIKTDNYEINQDYIGAIKYDRNTIGTLPPETESNKYHLDPQEELQTTLGSPLVDKQAPDRNNLSYIKSLTTIKLPTQLNTSGSISCYTGYPNLFEIPISNISTNMEASAVNYQLLTPNKSTNPYGFVSFTCRNPIPIHTKISGHVKCFIRVPSVDTVENYWFTLRNINTQDYENLERQNLANAHPYSISPPRRLDPELISFWTRSYYEESVINEWLDGYWVEVDFPIHGEITLNPETRYMFRIYRNHMKGEAVTVDNLKNTDLILTQGEISIESNIAPMINKRYYHLVKDFKNGN